MACLLGHRWNGCKCEKCGKTRDDNHVWQNGRCKQCGVVWMPTNSRFASNMPLSSLYKIFVFTTGSGKNVLECPISTGTLADTVGCHYDELKNNLGLHFDIIEHSNVGVQIQQTGQFPETAWTAMNTIDAGATLLAQTGIYRMCVRTFKTIRSESGAFVLLYRK